MKFKKVLLKGKVLENSKFTFNSYDDIVATEFDKLQIKGNTLIVWSTWGYKDYKRFKVLQEDKDNYINELQKEIDRLQRFINAEGGEEYKAEYASKIKSLQEELKDCETLKVAIF